MSSSPSKRQPIPFGKYLLLDRINIGGMAEVWRAKRYAAGGMEQLVAIKRILPNIAEDEEFIAMFIDEAKISVQLAHANVAKVQDLGHISNNYFIEVEYIPGKDMRAIFDRGRKRGERAPVPLVVHCVSKMCDALDYAHKKKDGQGRDMNIVHRDVSPQNVLISYEGDVKVIDFGIAKAAGKATRTQAGILKGKFGYMSPEQIRGANLDGRSDIFAIGVCLHEMLTGERLFVGESDYAVLEKVRKADVPRPSLVNPLVPPELEEIVLKALAREVEDRYQNASDLGDDLQRFLLSTETHFGRKDLVQYMQETFAEDVEREGQRLAEDAEVRAPPEVLAAAEAGFNGLAVPSSALPTQLNAPAGVRASWPGGPGGTPATAPSGVRASWPAGGPPPPSANYRRSPSLGAIPKPILPSAFDLPEGEDAQREATIMVDGRALFDATQEPLTHPGEESNSWIPVPPPRNPSEDDTSRNIGTVADLAEPPSDATPLSIDARALRASERDQATSRTESPLELLRRRYTPRQLGMAAAALALVVLLLAGLLGWLFREPPSGFLMVELPTEMRAGARVTLNGEELGVPSSWPMVQRTRAGRAEVHIEAPGYQPFTQAVDVLEGQQVTLLSAQLEREATRGNGDRGR